MRLMRLTPTERATVKGIAKSALVSIVLLMFVLHGVSDSCTIPLGRGTDTGRPVPPARACPRGGRSWCRRCRTGAQRWPPGRSRRLRPTRTPAACTKGALKLPELPQDDQPQDEEDQHRPQAARVEGTPEAPGLSRSPWKLGTSGMARPRGTSPGAGTRRPPGRAARCTAPEQAAWTRRTVEHSTVTR